MFYLLNILPMERARGHRGRQVTVDGARVAKFLRSGYGVLSWMTR